MCFIVLVCLVNINNLQAGNSATTTIPNPILFVTQVPLPLDTTTITSVFANHQATTKSCGRGGDLYILYPDSTLKNLTAAAGYGTSGLQGATAIAVREPSMHWSGTKALFSMIVGTPVSQSDSTQFFWQIYEVSGLGKNETTVITKVPNQPANYNNINPIYGTDERIIFSSDRPRNGLTYLYPQYDEYRTELANTGMLSLDPTNGDLIHLDHSPSGDFRPFIDSYGRLIFSRWDHLQRDSHADVDILEGNTYGSFNYSSEAANAAVQQNFRIEYFPEPQSSRTDLLAGTNVIGFEFNHFIPWQMNEDGTEGETMNHVGRHDLNIAFGKSLNDDPNLVNFSPSPTRTNQNSINNMVQLHEDPTSPGKYYGIDCMENGTHGAGQIITLAGAPTLDAQDMYVTYVTSRSTAFYLPENGTPNSTYTGHYRNPLPLSNGTLVCAHADENKMDKNLGTYSNPVSRYAFRLKSLKIQSGSILMADQPLTSGITKTVAYYGDSGLVNFSGTMWELDPVEVVARTKPTRRVEHIGGPELQVMNEEGVDTTQFRNYLIQHNLAVIVSRNMTNRNTDDHQQPFYLKVHNSSTQSPNPTGKVYDINHLRIYEADYLRGYGLVNGSTTPLPGRRVLAKALNDTSVHNPPNPSGPNGTVLIASDGSMAAFVPAHRAMSWELIDSSGTPVVRERFWVTFQPGEVRTCASCHGSNGEAAVPKQIIPQNEPASLHTLLQYWKNNLAPQGSGLYSVSKSWNMISVPRAVPDGRTSVLFPMAVSNAYAFKNGYVQKDTLVPGVGYWLKFNSSQNVAINGIDITSDTINVDAGWNLIGALSNDIPTTNITALGTSIQSQFYGYTNGYHTFTTLQGGRGYWVKVSASGQLVLASGKSLPKSVSAISNQDLHSFNTLTVRDANGNEQTLRFGIQSSAGSGSYEMPPTPPAGIFDVRFSSQQIAAVTSAGKPADFPLIVSSASYPVTISWKNNSRVMSAYLTVGEKKISLSGDGSVLVTGPNALLTLTLDAPSEIPVSFTLEQNYPNPFNPSTIINYQLPIDNYVTLKVYNMLGQVVATLADGVESAGYKSKEWDGSSMASGLYFYRLDATSISKPVKSVSQTRKMLLVK